MEKIKEFIKQSLVTAAYLIIGLIVILIYIILDIFVFIPEKTCEEKWAIKNYGPMYTKNKHSQTRRWMEEEAQDRGACPKKD